MVTVKFMLNGYQIEISGADAPAVEIDIVETRLMILQMPAVIPVRAEEPAPRADPRSDGAVGANSSHDRPDQKIIPVISIKSEKTKSGSLMYKVRGGQFDMWGVNCYPDTCLFKDGLHPTTIQNDVVSGLEALVKRDGKTWKVVALRRKQALAQESRL